MFLRMIWASVSARGARVLLAATAVTVGVGVAVALGSLALQVGDDLAQDLRRAGPNFVLRAEGASWSTGGDVQAAQAGGTVSVAAIEAMKKTFWKNNILEATPEMLSAAEVSLAGRSTPATIIGTWFRREVPTEDGPWVTGIASLRPRWTLEGAWPDDDRPEAALGRRLAERLEAGVGDVVTLQVAGTTVDVRITGIVAAGGADDDRAWAPLAVVEALEGRNDEIDRIWFSALVRPTPDKPIPDPTLDPEGFEAYMCAAYPANVARELTERIAGVDARPLSEIVAGEARVVSRLNLLMLLLALAGVTTAVLGLVSTTTASVLERRVEIGLLRSMGATPVHIALLLLGETILVSLLGGTLGWFFGGLAATAIRGDAFGSGAPLQPILLPLALGVALLVAVLGTLGPLRVALRVDPAEVLRG